MKYILVAVIASAITIFSLQNTTAVSLRFLFWSLPGTPLAMVILGSVAAGIVLVGFPFSMNRWRWRARARSLETQLAEAEASATKLTPPCGAPRPS